MRWIGYLVFAALCACGGEADERQEVLSKLRGLGVSLNPLVTEASLPTLERKVEATVYAALALGQTATVVPFVDIPAFAAIQLNPSEVEIVTSSLTYQIHHGFQVLSFKANLKVPQAALLVPFGQQGQVRFGFELTAGEESEKILANFLVYPEGAAELNQVQPQLSIVSPAEGEVLSSGSKVVLQATADTPNDEGLKLGWFVSDGKVLNRRSRDTRYEPSASGPQTLILTAHGRRSRGFAITFRNVNVE